MKFYAEPDRWEIFNENSYEKSCKAACILQIITIEAIKNVCSINYYPLFYVKVFAPAFSERTNIFRSIYILLYNVPLSNNFELNSVEKFEQTTRKYLFSERVSIARGVCRIGIAWIPRTSFCGELLNEPSSAGFKEQLIMPVFSANEIFAIEPTSLHRPAAIIKAHVCLYIPRFLLLISL